MMMVRRNTYWVVLGLLIALLVLAAPAPAKVITYDRSGSAGSVQDVISNASGGDSIFLPSGTYYGNLVIDRPIVFGGLDTANPPVIVSDNSSEAGLTLSSDGITVNGLVISGNATAGIVVRSNNNRISSTTSTGHPAGVSVRGGSNNYFVDNTIDGNSVGVNLDRSSRSNTFFLNSLNNSINVVSPGSQNAWYSGRQEYQYKGAAFSGPLGNYWAGTTFSDTDGNGVGDTPYTQDAPAGTTPGTSGVIDEAPLVSPPSAYTVTASSVPFNATGLGNLMQPRGDLATGLSPQSNNPQSSGSGFPSEPFTGSQQQGQGLLPDNLQPPNNPVGGFLARFWWLVPIAIIISVVGGILFERSRRRMKAAVPADNLSPAARNATVVKKPDSPGTMPALTDQEYGARLPAALEKRYPDAEYIAEGGVARVFKAHDEKNNRDIAVKVPIRFDEETGSQFTKELHVWEGLHHKNIVEIYAANIFPRPYIEMEFVESSLAGMKFPLDEPTAVRIVTGVAEGLEYAHEQGIVHRDIKPGNVLITPDGIPKITDWGLSKAQGTRQSGLIGFSLEYAAPEQLAPNLYGEPGPWTDIYQMGILFYEMLTGRVPFGGDGMGEITHAILHGEPEPALSEGPHAAAINAIIARCLKKNPKDRYVSVADLLADLQKL
ncbi:protein kinase domain-containing protein [Methanoregula sp. UBA64]|jgi:eukaryotic-like serine/threonine-protein kinase|uniref:protein kinase domain-containing protein n=1 Tax=Methanoregula sp. UBA64 TaxID=1915554 RepID=UPI0025EEDFE0|nr:protein kinase [Methanoregula sp. UBA64]